MGRLIRQIFLIAVSCLALPALAGAQTLQNTASGELNTFSLDLTQATITLNRLPLVDAGTLKNRYVTLENAGRDEIVLDGTAGMEPVDRQCG